MADELPSPPNEDNEVLPPPKGLLFGCSVAPFTPFTAVDEPPNPPNGDLCGPLALSSPNVEEDLFLLGGSLATAFPNIVSGVLEAGAVDEPNGVDVVAPNPPNGLLAGAGVGAASCFGAVAAGAAAGAPKLRVVLGASTAGGGVCSVGFLNGSAAGEALASPFGLPKDKVLDCDASGLEV